MLHIKKCCILAAVGHSGPLNFMSNNCSKIGKVRLAVETTYVHIENML